MPLMEDDGAAFAAAASNSPFLKQLASSNSQTRASALEHLRKYLRTRTGLGHLDMLKLWKGLFYCVWHSDRPKAQQALARDLASLVFILPGHEVAASWIRAFWETMAREWENIGSLRMDKYLYLCRCYVGAGFEWCRRAHWSSAMLFALVGVVSDIPLSTEIERRQMTNGLRLHILDLWVDEMEKCAGQSDGETASATESLPVDALMEPVRRLHGATRDKVLRTRAAEALVDERLAILKSARVEQPAPAEALADDSEEEWGGVDEG